MACPNCDRLRSELEKAQAACGEMRMALHESIGQLLLLHPEMHDVEPCSVFQAKINAERALENDYGLELLDRLAALEKVREAAEKVIVPGLQLAQNYKSWDEMCEALAACPPAKQP